MEFLNAVIWAVLIVATTYAGLNILFIINASAYEIAMGAGAVWFFRFLKSTAVVVVAALWLIFG